MVPVLPWQASLLLDYVQRCLDNLTTMHPQCSAIQAHTKAAELACAIFRQAPAQQAAGSTAHVPARCRCRCRCRQLDPAPPAAGAAQLSPPTWPASRPPATPPPPRRRVYFARGAPAQARLLGDAMLTQALLAAALWVAIKFEGNRCAMPDSSVMARITGGWVDMVGGHGGWWMLRMVAW